MNLRSKIGKKGWDFEIACGQLCASDPEGYHHESNMTKSESMIYQLGVDDGYINGTSKIINEIKGTLRI